MLATVMFAKSSTLCSIKAGISRGGKLAANRKVRKESLSPTVTYPKISLYVMISLDFERSKRK